MLIFCFDGVGRAVQRTGIRLIESRGIASSGSFSDFQDNAFRSRSVSELGGKPGSWRKWPCASGYDLNADGLGSINVRDGNFLRTAGGDLATFRTGFLVLVRVPMSQPDVGGGRDDKPAGEAVTATEFLTADGANGRG